MTLTFMLKLKSQTHYRTGRASMSAETLDRTGSRKSLCTGPDVRAALGRLRLEEQALDASLGYRVNFMRVGATQQGSICSRIN